jgi:anaerobic ribonucleoside-triphosphate reductase activating protein
MTEPSINKISVLRIIEDTTVDGVGFRTSIYGSGCENYCPGCHNPESWDIKSGIEMTLDELLAIVERNEFSDVTFSGGDPLFQVEGFTALARLIKERTDKTIWCYTGYTFEQILKSPRLRQILPHIDVLVDGRFEEDLKDLNLPFRGSRNQRIIDVIHSLEQNQVVEIFRVIGVSPCLV